MRATPPLHLTRETMRAHGVVDVDAMAECLVPGLRA
jgi:hypothetical protein